MDPDTIDVGAARHFHQVSSLRCWERVDVFMEVVVVLSRRYQVCSGGLLKFNIILRRRDMFLLYHMSLQPSNPKSQHGLLWLAKYLELVVLREDALRRY